MRHQKLDPGAKDITGQKFGRWTALEPVDRPAHTQEGGQFWLCQCDCAVPQQDILSGARLRAGRGNRPCNSCRYRGSHNDPTYHSWRGMRERCLNPRHQSWKNYGGRGITFCPEWNDYARFKSDMGPRPAGTSLDRIDVNGNYEPSNCRWVSAKEQARNTRRCRLTDEQVEAIRSIAEAGAREVDIAVAVGIARGHVSCILAGRAWK